MSAGQLRILKNRIKSVDSTKKITRAMEMVSAAKLRRYQGAMNQAKPYTKELEEMLGRLAADQAKTAESGDSGQKEQHPFFEEREEKKIAVVIVSSDAGLCGSFNSNVIELSRRFLKENKKPAQLIGVCKSATSALKRDGYDFRRTFINIRTNQIEPTIKELKTDLETLYLNKEIDSVYVIYTHYLNATSQKPKIEKILPFKKLEEQKDAKASKSEAVAYIYEPSSERVFQRLIPVFFEAKIRMMLLESFVSEYSARMNAMHQATKNAKEMIDSLVLVRNKVRQAIITKEIIEIVSGSQALKR